MDYDYIFFVRGSKKSIMGPKVKILEGQMSNTLGSRPLADVFDASVASAAKCFRALYLVAKCC